MAITLQDVVYADTDYISKWNANNTTIEGAVSTLETAIAGKQSTSEKGVAGGYASLDGTGKVPASQLPAAAAQPYDMPVSVAGKPGDAALVLKVVFTRAIVFPANFAGSQLNVGVNPTAQVTLTVTFVRGGATQATGTITVATNGTATFALAGGFTTQVGDVIKITNQATADATMEDLSITFVGTR